MRIFGEIGLSQTVYRRNINKPSSQMVFKPLLQIYFKEGRNLCGYKSFLKYFIFLNSLLPGIGPHHCSARSLWVPRYFIDFHSTVFTCCKKKVVWRCCISSNLEWVFSRKMIPPIHSIFRFQLDGLLWFSVSWQDSAPPRRVWTSRRTSSLPKSWWRMPPDRSVSGSHPNTDNAKTHNNIDLISEWFYIF